MLVKVLGLVKTTLFKPADLEGEVQETDEDEINARLNWVAFKQQFFSAIFIAKDGFDKPTYLTSTKSEGSKFIKDLSTKFELPYNHNRDEKLSFQFYFGPNHYKTLKSSIKIFCSM